MRSFADKTKSAVPRLAVVLARVLQDRDRENSEARASRIPCLTKSTRLFSVKLNIHNLYLYIRLSGGGQQEAHILVTGGA